MGQLVGLTADHFGGLGGLDLAVTLDQGAE